MLLLRNTSLAMLIWLALLVERITARLATVESLFLLGFLKIPSCFRMAVFHGMS